jgi:hypothetical protein
MTKTESLQKRASNFEMGGVDYRDYPDFCDAFIENCDIDGREATEEELELLNEDSAFVYEQAIASVF